MNDVNRSDLNRMPTDRRRTLVRRAAAEFADHGYERASLNRVISSCRMSKSSFYYAVSSKQELFDLVVADLSAEITTTVSVPAPDEFRGDTFWSRLQSLGSSLFAAVESDEAYRHLGRMFYLRDAPIERPDKSDPSDQEGPDREGAGREGAGREPGGPLAAIRQWLGDVLEIGRDSGQVRRDLPPELQLDATFAVLQAFDRWGVDHAADLTPDRAGGLLEVTFAALRRLLSPDLSAGEGAIARPGADNSD